MLRGLYTSYTGMSVQQTKLDTISNNIANANTVGYKKDGLLVESFDKVMATKINDPDTNFNKGIGEMSLGARVERTYVNFDQGALRQTNDPYNMAIEGDGMFTIGQYDSEGNILTDYTRDGSFALNQDGMLATQDGYFVMGENGPIQINGDYSLKSDGTIVSNGEVIDKLQLVGFNDYDLLTKLGSGNYENVDETNVAAFDGTVVQGYVESSNVNSVNEMVNLINVMRTYEANQKVMTTYDDTLDKAVNTVGKV